MSLLPPISCLLFLFLLTSWCHNSCSSFFLFLSFSSCLSFPSSFSSSSVGGGWGHHGELCWGCYKGLCWGCDRKCWGYLVAAERIKSKLDTQAYNHFFPPSYEIRLPSSEDLLSFIHQVTVNPQYNKSWYAKLTLYNKYLLGGKEYEEEEKYNKKEIQVSTYLAPPVPYGATTMPCPLNTASSAISHLLRPSTSSVSLLFSSSSLVLVS